MSTVHVIGAGLAGLACAVRLVQRGRRVALYEAAPQAGGRCRSYVDATLGCVIDNGNHLLLSGNRATLRYLDEIDARDRLAGPPKAVFPFVDLASGARWSIRPGPGLLPRWIFDAGRRIPGTRARHYLSLPALRLAGRHATVAGCIAASDPLFRPFWQPLTLAMLNAAPEDASARLLWAALRESILRGEGACRPLLARQGLSAAFVDPALAYLRCRGVPIGFNRRLRALQHDGGRATALAFGDAVLALARDDHVVLALPPAAAAGLLPGLAVPPDGPAIVNVHYRLDRARDLVPEPGFLGVLGGAAHWIFGREDVVSVTVSAADELASRPSTEVAGLLWRDARRALGLPADEAQPPARVIKERRATFAQVPASLRRRPGCRTRLANLKLAGDWTDTHLPATIEGAVRSGRTAAEAVCR